VAVVVCGHHGIIISIIIAYHFQFSSFLIQFCHLHIKLGFSLGQFQFLGSDDFDDAVVDVESSDPLADSFTRLGRVLHQRRLKLRVCHVPTRPPHPAYA